MDLASDGRLTADPDPRQRVFVAVLERGPVSAAMLAARLGVTPAAVRRHLDALEADGLVESVGASASGQRGRPARRFVVTTKGQESARGQYDELAAAALGFVAERLGGEAVADFADRYTAELERHWGEQLDAVADAPGPERVTALATALTRDGYAASARPVVARRRRTRRGVAPGGAPVNGTQLCQGHCPVTAVATRYPELCEAETRAFSRLLGVHVQRLSTIAAGAHVCTTFVPHPRADDPGETPARASHQDTDQVNDRPSPAGGAQR